MGFKDKDPNHHREIPPCNISLDNKKIEQVSQFDYLGSLITSDVRSEKEIKRRIAIAKKAFETHRKTLTNKNFSIETRERFIQCYSWSTLMYSCEN